MRKEEYDSQIVEILKAFDLAGVPWLKTHMLDIAKKQRQDVNEVGESLNRSPRRY